MLLGEKANSTSAGSLELSTHSLTLPSDPVYADVAMILAKTIGSPLTRISTQTIILRI